MYLTVIFFAFCFSQNIKDFVFGTSLRSIELILNSYNMKKTFKSFRIKWKKTCIYFNCIKEKKTTKKPKHILYHSFCLIYHHLSQWWMSMHTSYIYRAFVWWWHITRSGFYKWYTLLIYNDEFCTRQLRLNTCTFSVNNNEYRAL